MFCLLARSRIVCSVAKRHLSGTVEHDELQIMFAKSGVGWRERGRTLRCCGQGITSPPLPPTAAALEGHLVMGEARAREGAKQGAKQEGKQGEREGGQASVMHTEWELTKN